MVVLVVIPPSRVRKCVKVHHKSEILAHGIYVDCDYLVKLIIFSVGLSLRYFDVSIGLAVLLVFGFS